MSALFLRLLYMSEAAGIVVIVVLLARLLLKKAPKKWSYLLWLAVAFRLCCPLSIGSGLSLFNLIPVRAAETAAQNTVYNIAAADKSALQAEAGEAEPAGQQDAIASAPAEGAAPHIPAAAQVADAVDDGAPQAAKAEAPAAETAAEAPPAAKALTKETLLNIGAWLWLAGLAGMLAFGAARYISLRKMTSAAIKAEGMSRVYFTDAAGVPFVIGIFRPRIMLPFGLDSRELDTVLSHERCHIRRGDNVVKAFAYLLLAVHWFDPLCWLAFVLMSRDMEMSCDERVLSAGADPADYASTLLAFASKRRFPAPEPLAFGESNAAKRIKNAVGYKRPKRIVSITAALLCCAVLTACSLNAKDGKDAAELSPTASAAPTQQTAQPARTPDAATTPAPARTSEPAQTQAPIPTQDYETPKMSHDGYVAFCLSVMYNEQSVNVDPEMLEQASEVWFRFEGGKVSVYEDAEYVRGEWRFHGLIRELPAEAFINSFMTGYNIGEDKWYMSPETEPETTVVYRGYLGDDWAMPISEPSGSAEDMDKGFMVFANEDWTSFRFTEMEWGYIKTGAGRCGDVGFVFAKKWEESIQYFATEGAPYFSSYRNILMPHPEEGQTLYFSALSPVFSGERGVLPVKVFDKDLRTNSTIWYLTYDGGKSWGPARPAEPQQTGEKESMTRARYNELCLSVLSGNEPEQMNYYLPESGARVYFRLNEGMVEVYDNGEFITGKWQLDGLICTLPVEAFVPPEYKLRAVSQWYCPPDRLPEGQEVFAQGYMGEDWIMLVSELASGNTGALFIVSDDDWASASFVNCGYAAMRTSGGRCGDSLFFGERYGEDKIVLFRTRDMEHWQTVELELREFSPHVLCTPLPMVFEGNNGVLPVYVQSRVGSSFSAMLWYVTRDGGETWQVEYLVPVE